MREVYFVIDTASIDYFATSLQVNASDRKVARVSEAQESYTLPEGTTCSSGSTPPLSARDCLSISQLTDGNVYFRIDKSAN